MFERFSDEARQAVRMAPQHARELGHRAVGSEHLLLSLLELGDGNARSALEQLLSAGRVSGRPAAGYVPERFPGSRVFPAREYLLHDGARRTDRR
jgi:Clp amino terminal domain, pathogenicity island component